ncbi:uncharacterized protein LOC110379854 [Helicoverpa armigera]|uniref:Uncharacterized protein n=1 Tax=Helicoverpa armigera TaxID=29058 RepID=A0A2W1BHA8_HELAM|nr:uncharacterized protein LOC110379854 [Helicoverpa armigera]PZC74218.1 hypothetical protein B5X24_HaOG208171 [Helicoverpa armigera]
MGSLGFWSMIAILLQTLLCVIISWLTLGCQLKPDVDELHEVTLMKILYLYDPEACGRIYFYNLTTSTNYEKIRNSVVWLEKNHISSRFRTKMQLWLSLHLIWLLFAVINVTQGQRSCSFYASLLPFTISGLTLMLADFIYAILFLIDAAHTSNESEILGYLGQGGRIRSMDKKPISRELLNEDDTSWIAVLLAYISLRGIVQWIVNFWIVKDNYYEGLAGYRRILRLPKHRTRTRNESLD